MSDEIEREGVAADFLPACGSLLFSHRKQLAEHAEKWCRENGAEVCPVNIVTALNNMGVIFTEQTPATAPVDAVVMRTVAELCSELGIELRGDDGQPFHCGERMRLISFSPDYAECKCGLRIGNAASPHISGCIASEQWCEEHGMRTWVKLSA